MGFRVVSDTETTYEVWKIVSADRFAEALVFCETIEKARKLTTWFNESSADDDSVQYVIIKSITSRERVI